MAPDRTDGDGRPDRKNFNPEGVFMSSRIVVGGWPSDVRKAEGQVRNIALRLNARLRLVSAHTEDEMFRGKSGSDQ